jgi:hypothetical protein
MHIPLSIDLMHCVRLYTIIIITKVLGAAECVVSSCVFVNDNKHVVKYVRLVSPSTNDAYVL